jgi:alpha-tubulin suppressor-like RCC1 family protein
MPFHQVYTCGHGAGGRLGLNDANARDKYVGPLGSLDNQAFIGIRCKSKHTLAATNKGEVFSWGYNQFGQTGNDEFHTSES